VGAAPVADSIIQVLTGNSSNDAVHPAYREIHQHPKSTTMRYLTREIMDQALARTSGGMEWSFDRLQVIQLGRVSVHSFTVSRSHHSSPLTT
jgi:hypothetical protein